MISSDAPVASRTASMTFLGATSVPLSAAFETTRADISACVWLALIAAARLLGGAIVQEGREGVGGGCAEHPCLRSSGASRREVWRAARP